MYEFVRLYAASWTESEGRPGVLREPTLIMVISSKSGRQRRDSQAEGIEEAQCLLFLMWYSFHDHDDPLGINVQPKRAKTQP